MSTRSRPFTNTVGISGLTRCLQRAPERPRFIARTGPRRFRAGGAAETLPLGSPPRPPLDPRPSPHHPRVCGDQFPYLLPSLFNPVPAVPAFPRGIAPDARERSTPLFPAAEFGGSDRLCPEGTTWCRRGGDRGERRGQPATKARKLVPAAPRGAGGGRGRGGDRGDRKAASRWRRQISDQPRRSGSGLHPGHPSTPSRPTPSPTLRRRPGRPP